MPGAWELARERGKAERGGTGRDGVYPYKRVGSCLAPALRSDGRPFSTAAKDMAPPESLTLVRRFWISKSVSLSLSLSTFP